MGVGGAGRARHFFRSFFPRSNRVVFSLSSVKSSLFWIQILYQLCVLQTFSVCSLSFQSPNNLGHTIFEADYLVRPLPRAW